MTWSEGALEITITAPNWGLPSSEPQCLECLLYVKCAALPSSIKHSNFPYLPLTGPLPCVTWGNEAKPAWECVFFLQQSMCDLDEHLCAATKADLFAYNNLVLQRIDPPTDFIYWLVDQSFPIKSYAKSTPFPARTLLRQKKTKLVRQQCEQLGLKDKDEAVRRITEAYSALALRLGAHKYFSKTTRPSSLDVKVASRIAFHFHTPFADNPFKEILLRQFPVLIAHFHGLCESYLQGLYTPLCKDVALVQALLTEALPGDDAPGAVLRIPAVPCAVAVLDDPSIRLFSRFRAFVLGEGQSATDQRAWRNKVFCAVGAGLVLSVVGAKRYQAQAQS